MFNSKADTDSRNARIDRYVNIGFEAGRQDGLIHGGFWGLVAGLLIGSYFL